MGDYFIDFAVPDLSAFTMLGVDGSRVSRPGNVRELAVALQNGFGTSGTLEQGLGLEVAPFWVAKSPDVVGDYNGIVHRFSVSAATLKANDTTRVGFGFRWVPIDHADPYDSEELRQALLEGLQEAMSEAVTPAERNALTKRVFDFADSTAIEDTNVVALSTAFDVIDLKKSTESEKAASLIAVGGVDGRVKAILDAEGIVLSDAQRDTLDALVRDYTALATKHINYDAESTASKEIAKRREAFRDTMWNAFSLQLASGATVATPGDVDFGFSWSSFVGVSLPLIHRYGQFLVHGQLDVPLEDSSDVRVAVGGRLILGSASNRFSLEGLWGSNDERLTGESSYRITVGGEFRLSEGTYLELATGVNLPDEGGSNLITLGSIKYAIGKERRYGLPTEYGGGNERTSQGVRPFLG